MFFWFFFLGVVHTLCCKDFFDHLPLKVDIFYGMNVDKKWTFLAHLPTSSCKRSLWMTPTEMAGSEWGKPYSWSIKLCKSAPAKSAVGDHIYSPLLLLLLAIIQKRTQYLCYGLLKKKWRWRIFLGQDRTAGPKLSLFSKNVWLDNRFFKLSLIVFSSFTQIFERTIVCQNVLGTALADQ